MLARRFVTAPGRVLFVEAWPGSCPAPDCAAAGLRLVGTAGGACDAVVFSPGLASARDGAKSEASRRLAARWGAAFVRYDPFGQGASSGQLYDATVSGAARDLQLLMECTEALAGARRVLLVGASLGALTSLRAAASAAPELRARVLGVVCLGGAFGLLERLEATRAGAKNEQGDLVIASPYVGELRLAPAFLRDLRALGVDERLAANLTAPPQPVPVLVIHGRRDAVVPLADARDFFSALGDWERAGGGAEEWARPQGLSEMLELPQGCHRLEGEAEAYSEAVEAFCRRVVHANVTFDGSATPRDLP
jgi:pimeloyl-ACP methyl ester carboxylesterase